MTENVIAVLDRIVDGKLAVLLLEAGGETVDELVLDVEELPTVGRHPNAIFAVEMVGGELIEAEYMPEEEEKRITRMKQKFDQLATRPDEVDPSDLQ